MQHTTRIHIQSYSIDDQSEPGCGALPVVGAYGGYVLPAIPLDAVLQRGELIQVYVITLGTRWWWGEVFGGGGAGNGQAAPGYLQ